MIGSQGMREDSAVERGPALPDLARRWLDGEIDDDEYFARCWEWAYERARRDVRARLFPSANGGAPARRPRGT